MRRFPRLKGAGVLRNFHWRKLPGVIRQRDRDRVRFVRRHASKSLRFICREARLPR